MLYIVYLVIQNAYNICSIYRYWIISNASVFVYYWVKNQDKYGKYTSCLLKGSFRLTHLRSLPDYAWLFLVTVCLVYIATLVKTEKHIPRHPKTLATT